MNTKLKNDFRNALKFANQDDKAGHDSKILMFKFLSIIEDKMALRNMSKKELAQLLNTSPSYVTQLFRGTKTINLMKLAQLQSLFHIEFEIGFVNKTKKKSNKSNTKPKLKSFAIAR